MLRPRLGAKLGPEAPGVEGRGVRLLALGGRHWSETSPGPGAGEVRLAMPDGQAGGLSLRFMSGHGNSPNVFGRIKVGVFIFVWASLLIVPGGSDGARLSNLELAFSHGRKRGLGSRVRVEGAAEIPARSTLSTGTVWCRPSLISVRSRGTGSPRAARIPIAFADRGRRNYSFAQVLRHRPYSHLLENGGRE